MNQSPARILSKIRSVISELESIDDGLLPEVFFTHVCKQLQIGSGAIFKSFKLIKILEDSDKEKIETAYKQYLNLNFLNSIIEKFVFVRLREFSGYIFCFNWSIQELLEESLTQAVLLREQIIKIINNRSIMEALCYLTDERDPPIFVKAEGVKIVALKEKEQKTLNIPFKTIPLYFPDEYLLKINRSIAVNPAEVVVVDKISYRKMELMMSNGIGVSVSEGRIKEVSKFFNKE